ncbi:hypothetical protein HETIRDRAFT_146807 [Heterobasidion irregulare TC 32-1]|uniref:GRAM domain-containing protein n=1 Tax=Heterobasidion irregulare (strain TC 32-1) TaxID=747525 RepID=W4KEP5_HETIT|nr:uncharacterized protein HETIRDRAFT_146807 [Heterobasidion irregulare TC 32-1]ETW84219.1 hypothetical protein HETIRDRAFT_146807 [Heterobasidion irregulare TC 32-1]
MALNWTMLKEDRTPIPLPGETTIMTIHTGAEVALTIPDAPPSAGATSGGSGGTKKLEAVGRLWLTDQRLIFVVPSAHPSSFESLSIPLHSLISTKFQQPMLGANYLSLEIKPSPEGGLRDGTKADIRLRDQGLFQFVSMLEKTRERVIYMRRQALEDEENLPAYASPAEPASSSQIAGTPVDAPPGYIA